MSNKTVVRACSVLLTAMGLFACGSEAAQATASSNEPVGSLAEAVNLGPKLTQNMIMKPGDYLLSSNGLYQVTMLQSGNLTLGVPGQTTQPPAWLWQSNTAGLTYGKCEMFPNGDLIIMRSNGTYAYHSATTNNAGGYMIVTDGGDLQIRSSNDAIIWDNGGIYLYQ
jgi:hypothetical protein